VSDGRGITVAQKRLLGELAPLGEVGRTRFSLAAQLGSTPQGVARSLASLEHRGLVYQPNKHVWAVTPEGLALMDGLLARLEW